MSSDLNPSYLDFWPVVSKVWKEKFNITPVLGLVCNENSDFFEWGDGICKKFKQVDGVSIALQSQTARLFLTKELTGSLIISDIDMLPLSQDYFITQFESFSTDKLYILGSDNECVSNNEYPMCYLAATFEKFNEILDINVPWEKFVYIMNDLNLGWATDQKYVFGKVQQHLTKEKNDIVLLERGWEPIARQRIDRIFWSYEPALVKSGYYIDSHLLRPYSVYKQQIDTLVNSL